LTPTRPYLLRAFYEWIVDNHLTPYVVVMASMPGVDVPQKYVEEDGRIILNVAPSAVHHLDFTHTSLSFDARFGGIPHSVFVPMRAVAAIYAKENGRGMVFKEEDWEEETLPSALPRTLKAVTGSGRKKPGHKGRPKLTLIKGDTPETDE
jgi:stringent starvation protein B